MVDIIFKEEDLTENWRKCKACRLCLSTDYDVLYWYDFSWQPSFQDWPMDEWGRKLVPDWLGFMTACINAFTNIQHHYSHKSYVIIKRELAVSVCFIQQNNAIFRSICKHWTLQALDKNCCVQKKMFRYLKKRCLQLNEIWLHLDESLQHPDNKCLQMDRKIALFWWIKHTETGNSRSIMT